MCYIIGLMSSTLLFALKCKNMYRMGPRSEVGRRTSDRGKVRGSFFQAGGWRAEADEKESFYFPLGTPSKRGLLEKYFNIRLTTGLDIAAYLLGDSEVHSSNPGSGLESENCTSFFVSSGH